MTKAMQTDRKTDKRDKQTVGQLDWGFGNWALTKYQVGLDRNAAPILDFEFMQCLVCYYDVGVLGGSKGRGRGNSSSSSFPYTLYHHLSLSLALSLSLSLSLSLCLWKSKNPHTKSSWPCEGHAKSSNRNRRK